jgi:DNA-binding MarR family transcriptional regulator
LAWNADCGQLSLTQICERLQVTPATVTSAIDRLEADGLVRRLQHPSDARSTLAEITAKGLKTVAAATDVLNEKVYEAIPLSESQMESLIQLLLTIRVDAGDFSADGPADQWQKHSA